MSDKQQTEQQIKFLSAAIVDTVGTIRNLDLKNQIFLGLCIVPLARIDYLLIKLQCLIELFFLNKLCLLPLLLIAFFLCWLICIFTLVWGIKGRFNPKTIISCNNKTEEKPTGYFYSPGEIKYNGYTKNFEDMLSHLPKNDEMIIREMAYEHMKLCYIRHIKMLWHQRFLRFFAIWGVVGIVLIGVMFDLGFNFSL